MNPRARTYYENASEIAALVSQKVNEGIELLNKRNDLQQRLETWKRKLLNTPLFIFSVLFIIIAIAEYFISYPIYEVVIPQAPAWIIALAFFVVGIVISHYLAEKLESMKAIKFYEYRRDPNNENLTDEQIHEKINKQANLHFIIALIFGIFLIVVIQFLALERVRLEKIVNPNRTDFGIIDLLPAFLYAVELFVGIWFIKLLLLTYLNIKLWMLNRKLKKNIRLIGNMNSQVVEEYTKAEQHGFSPIEHEVSDNIQTAFYREDSLSPEEIDDYLQIPERENKTFKFKIVDNEGNGVRTNVSFISQFLVTHSGATNANGEIEITISTFPNDVIQEIIIEQSIIRGTYDNNNQNEIII